MAACVIRNMQRSCAYLTAGGHSPVQRSEPLVIFGINSGTYRSEDSVRSNCYVTFPQHHWSRTCILQWKSRRQKVNLIINTVIKPLLAVLIIVHHSLQHQQREACLSRCPCTAWRTKMRMWRSRQVRRVYRTSFTTWCYQICNIKTDNSYISMSQITFPLSFSN